MENQNIYEDLVADLIYLKKSSGFVSSRVYQADTFLTFIGGDNQVLRVSKFGFSQRSMRCRISNKAKSARRLWTA
jgi:GTP cyclohydrolase III